jgi:hypothetical protein
MEGWLLRLLIRHTSAKRCVLRGRCEFCWCLTNENHQLINRLDWCADDLQRTLTESCRTTPSRSDGNSIATRRRVCVHQAPRGKWRANSCRGKRRPVTPRPKKAGIHIHVRGMAQKCQRESRWCDNPRPENHWNVHHCSCRRLITRLSNWERTTHLIRRNRCWLGRRHDGARNERRHDDWSRCLDTGESRQLINGTNRVNQWLSEWCCALLNNAAFLHRSSTSRTARSNRCPTANDFASNWVGEHVNTWSETAIRRRYTCSRQAWRRSEANGKNANS